MTVLSIKAMLEPRIVAASIQRPACAAHGTSAFTDRTTASSHGGFMKAMDAFSSGLGSGSSPGCFRVADQADVASTKRRSPVLGGWHGSKVHRLPQDLEARKVVQCDSHSERGSAQNRKAGKT